MANQSFIQVRVDDDLKQEANAVLNEIGIDMPNAIRMFLKRVVLERGLPFETKLPSMDPISAECIPEKPFLLVSMEEYLTLLCQVPAGKITRRDDIEKYLAKKHEVARVRIEDTAIGYRPDVPFWRELSTRGMLKDYRFHCDKERQRKMLEQEGLTIVPCGAYNKSLKVDNYLDYLFDFETCTESGADEYL